MNTTQPIDKVGAIVHSTVTTVKTTSLLQIFNVAFQAGLETFAAAFVASLFATESSPLLPQTELPA